MVSLIFFSDLCHPRSLVIGGTQDLIVSNAWQISPPHSFDVLHVLVHFVNLYHVIFNLSTPFLNH